MAKGKKSHKPNTMFKPNQKQIALLRAWADPKQKPTITAVCEAANVDRSTYYRWFDNEEFVAWFEESWAIAMKGTQHYLDLLGLKKAVKDYRYWEGMQMKYHKFARKEESKTDENQFKETMKLLKGLIEDDKSKTDNKGYVQEPEG